MLQHDGGANRHARPVAKALQAGRHADRRYRHTGHGLASALSSRGTGPVSTDWGIGRGSTFVTPRRESPNVFATASGSTVQSRSSMVQHFGPPPALRSSEMST